MGVDEVGLYANRNEYKDFVYNAIQRFAADGCNIYIAVAFFTEADVVEDLLSKGCRIRLVVRLGFPTRPNALQRLMGKVGVEIRYFTGHAFHPKVYIFGNKAALVGSANLTRSAIRTNQEVVISIDSNDPRLTELSSLFGDYWSEAKVLDQETLDKYKLIFQQFEKHQVVADKLGQDVLDKLGTSQPSNITRDKVKASRESLFLEDFRKTYQECVSAFNIVREVYLESGYRKVDSAVIPLRIEIDSFISFVREQKAGGESWINTPLRSAIEQRQVIAALIEEWRSIAWPHFEERIVGENYPRLLRTFKSESALMAASDDDLFDALSTLHSFYDRFRFYLGGLPTWKKTFLAANEPTRVRKTLAYLVFGKDKTENRMVNVIYDSHFKLNAFGQANVQELIGWVNREELPIINGRTTKVLRFFGSDVRQLS
ncbi:MAG: phospholipase D family protein [Gammaproteobacteria bacterium]|nr:phospholipase D family protein [Gammaproteobacteria bacterium]